MKTHIKLCNNKSNKLISRNDNNLFSSWEVCGLYIVYHTRNKERANAHGNYILIFP